MFKFKMGQPVKDIVTGYTGVIIARVEYLTGCNQYHVLPTNIKKGEYKEGRYFDETRLQITPGKIIAIADAKDDPGADTAPPTRK